jgi:hypothetical protein
MLTSSTVLKLRDDARYRLIGEEAVVLQQTNAEVIVLNEIGARILGLIDGNTGVPELVAVLANEYAATAEQLEHDILAYLNALLDAGIVEVTGSPGAAPA